MESYAHRMEIKALLTLLTDTRIVPRAVSYTHMTLPTNREV